MLLLAESGYVFDQRIVQDVAVVALYLASMEGNDSNSRVVSALIGLLQPNRQLYRNSRGVMTTCPIRIGKNAVAVSYMLNPAFWV